MAATVSSPVATDAVDLLPILHSNRSAAYASLNRYHDALADASIVVKLRPNWPKAYTRLASAHVGLGRLDDAFSACKKCIEIDSGNCAIKSTIVHAWRLATQHSSFAELMGKLRADAVVSGYLHQEEFVKRLRKIMKSPSSVTNYLADQRIMGVLGVLLNIKIKPQKESSIPESSGRPVAPMQQTELIEVRDLQGAALRKKDAGNAAYAKKDFELAIRHYTCGLELVGKLKTCISSQYMQSRFSTGSHQSSAASSSHPQNAFQVAETPVYGNEIRVSHGGGMHNTIAYATILLQEKGFNEIVFKALGRAISKTVMIVEIIKRNIVGLHQNTTIGSAKIPSEGLFLIEGSKKVPMITVTLSKKKLDSLSPGYQSPLSTKNGNRQREVWSGERFPRGRGRGHNIQGSRRSIGNDLITSVFNDKDRENMASTSNMDPLNCKQGQWFYDDGSRRKDRPITCHSTVNLGEAPADILDQGTGMGTKENVSADLVNLCDKDNSSASDDDDCIVLESNPFEEEIINNVSPTIPKKLSLDGKGVHFLCQPVFSQRCSDEDEISIIAERGQVACRDYPHSRHLCGQYPFDKTSHETHCSQCYCYVCDISAPCNYWEGVVLGHCNATEFEPFWKEMRIASKADPTGPFL